VHPRAHRGVGEIVDLVARAFPAHASLVAVQLHESVRTDGLAEVRGRLKESSVRLYDLNAPGENHRLLLGC
jgi:hypothetical protein